jgi:hypothetical protein
MGFSGRAVAAVAGIGMLVMTGDFGTTARAQAPARAAQAPAAAATPPNLNGVWTRTRSQKPSPLPLNKRGLALQEVLDESLTPIFDCVPETVPHILGDPYNFSFEQQNDRVIQRFEKDAVVRTLWLEGHGHREAANSDYGVHGYSMARYEGDTLVVVTTKFTFEVGGIEDKMPMVPSSTLKKVTERYSRNGDQLVADVTLEDKAMLTEPITFRYEFKPTKEALIEWPECDPEEARAPFNYIPLDQLKYGVR